MAEGGEFSVATPINVTPKTMIDIGVGVSLVGTRNGCHEDAEPIDSSVVDDFGVDIGDFGAGTHKRRSYAMNSDANDAISVERVKPR